MVSFLGEEPAASICEMEQRVPGRTAELATAREELGGARSVMS